MLTNASAALKALRFNILYGAHCFVFPRNFRLAPSFRFVRLVNGVLFLRLGVGVDVGFGFGFGGDFFIIITSLLRRNFSLLCFFLLLLFVCRACFVDLFLSSFMYLFCYFLHTTFE